MKSQEMEIYNHIASEYEKNLLSGEKRACLQICQNVQEYLKGLKPKTRMYGDGEKWTTAAELLDYNKTRIERLERELYSVCLGGVHRKTSKYSK